MMVITLTTHLSKHVQDANHRDEHRSLFSIEPERLSIVSYVDVVHVIPHVEEEVGDREDCERWVQEVAEVQHVDGEV